jgi:type IV fimbrial biogenesis protein FimT
LLIRKNIEPYQWFKRDKVECRNEFGIAEGGVDCHGTFLVKYFGMHTTEKKMSKQSGFTIIELAVVIAIIGIVSAIAVPNMIGWASRSRVNGAARDIVSMVQKARIEAVRNNEQVYVTFDPDNDGSMDVNYIAFLDDGQGTADADSDGVLDGADNGIQDGTERTVYQGQMPAGVTLSGVPLGAGAGDTSFNPRAMPSFAGPIALTNNSGYTVTVTIGSAGIPTISN